MTTELVVLLALCVFILFGGFLGNKGPKKVFFNSGPRLGARVESQLATGRGFNFVNGKKVAWVKPPPQ